MVEYNKEHIIDVLNKEESKLGDIKKLAKTIKKDHEFALKLWSSEEFNYRMLSVLIMDKKQITEELIRSLIVDLNNSSISHRTQVTDWLFANQLMKDKKLSTLMLSWQNDELSLLRRLFWYYQARLRWTGKVPINNAEALLFAAEKEIMNEVEEVQWAINFCIAQIGIFEEAYRNRCIKLGETSELYKDEVAPKGCTPNYLPDFITIQVKKNNSK